LYPHQTKRLKRVRAIKAKERAMRALVIQDDPIAIRLMDMILENEGIAFERARTGGEGIELARLYDFDIVLIDLRRSAATSCDVVRQLRGSRVGTPVLILSGLGEPSEKVKGLAAGADDYLTLPFNRDELLARMRAIVRRAKGHSRSTLTTGRLVLDIDARTAEVDGQPLHLTGKEYSVLELLALRRGTVLTKEMFLDHLYGGMDEPEVKIIDVFVCKLRKKIAALNRGEHYIETVWGRGYGLRDPRRADPPAERRAAVA
jgi:two-component system cell cycle response regulator CtrA